MRFPWEHDLRRTCNKCGEFWDVPYLLRRPKPESWRKSKLRRRDMAVRGRVDPFRGRQAVVRTTGSRSRGMHDERELIIGLARCPSCLTSNDFTDTRKA
jgi:hypothetical protein